MDSPTPQKDERASVQTEKMVLDTDPKRAVVERFSVQETPQRGISGEILSTGDSRGGGCREILSTGDPPEVWL